MRCTYCNYSLPPTESPEGGTAAAAAQIPRQAVVASMARRSLLASCPPPLRSYWEGRLRGTIQTLCALVHYYKRHRARTPLRAVWRKRAKAAAGAPAGGEPTTKLDKLVRATPHPTA